MKRITAVFPTLAEAEAAYSSLRELQLAQGAISLLADSSHQVNSRTDDSGSSDPSSNSAVIPGTLEAPLIAPVGMVGGVGGAGGAYVPAVLLETVSSDLKGGTGHRLLGPGTPGSSGPMTSATLEGFTQAGFAPDEAQYYSSAVSQGHAVLSIELSEDEQEARVRQIISQNDGHPFTGAAQ